MPKSSLNKIGKETSKALERFRKALPKEGVARDVGDERLRSEAEASVKIEYPKEDFYGQPS